MTQNTITIFNKSGPSNTDRVIALAKDAAEKHRVKSVVVASTTGETGVKVAEAFKGYNVVIVTHNTGYREPDLQELTPQKREQIQRAGGQILTTAHAFGGLGRAIRRKLNTYQYDEIIASTLRIFGQGTKVAVEIAMMAADAGLVSTKEDLLSIGGTDKGADTALILNPSNTQDFFNLKIHTIICKPWLGKKPNQHSEYSH